MFKECFILFPLLIFIFTGCENVADIGDPSVQNMATFYGGFSNVENVVNQNQSVSNYTSFGSENGLLSMSNVHVCVLMLNGKLKCWGSNNNSQLGDGTQINRETPVWASSVNASTPGKMIVSVAVGFNYSCGFYTTDGLKCWGAQDHGKLGNNQNSGNTSTAVAPSVLSLGDDTVKMVALGESHVCVLLEKAQSVKCWGKNNYNQLLNGQNTDSLSPVSISSLSNIVSMSSSNESLCALSSAKRLFCWGKDFAESGTSPLAINTSNDVERVGGSDSTTAFFCAVLQNQTAQCFGTSNNRGQLGNGTSTAPASASQAVTVLDAATGSALQQVIAVVTGASHACAIVGASSSVYCWGDNQKNQLGLGTAPDFSIRKAVKVSTSNWPSRVTVSDIAASDDATCLLFSNDDVYCWGADSQSKGVLGLGSSQRTVTKPTKVLNRADP
jgi:alpha-tubulin suppressor-like RCC1 family protein